MSERPLDPAMSRSEAAEHARVRLHLDPMGRLVLTKRGDPEGVPVMPHRCFPLSAPKEWISFLDPQGREVATLEAWDDLDEASRGLLSDVLSREEFVPRVMRIHSASKGSTPTTFDLDTDRGRCLIVVDSDEGVRVLASGSILLTDRFGVRYFVRDLTALDKRSRRLLETRL